MNRRFPEFVAWVALLAIGVVGTSGCGSSGPRASGCDLVAQTGCALGQKCKYTCGGSGAVIACVADGTLAVGAQCLNGDMCVAGSFCAARPEDQMQLCRKLCDTDADCATGTCMHLPLSFCGTATTAGICG